MLSTIEIDTHIPEDWVVDENEKVYSINHKIYVTRAEVMERMPSPFGLTQMTGSSRRTYINKEINIPETEAEYKATKDETKGIPPFTYLKDTVASCCATLEGLPFQSTVDFNTELYNLHQKYKKQAFELNGGKSKGKVVSSSIPDSKKKVCSM